LSVPIKIATIIGFILALPIILWQVWSFVSPGLRPVEKRFAGPFIASAILLFGVGAAFAYFVMPLGLGFLAGFLGNNAMYFPDINQYLSFFLLLVVIFGVTFELPVVLVLLGAMHIISSRWLREKRKAAIVLIIAAAAIVTPGADPFTPTALAIPLILLYEASILVLAKLMHR
jgi:sec-independent protein translocase protein TatC